MNVKPMEGIFKMGSLNLYKCKKEAVCPASSDNKYVKAFLLHIERNHNTYIESADDLKEIFCESEEEFQTVDAFMIKHKLYDFDLVVEE